jgi:hypothetical protein
METKFLIVLAFAALFAFAAATSTEEDDSSTQMSGSNSFEKQEEDCDRLVDGSDENDGKCDLTDGLEEAAEKCDKCSAGDKDKIKAWIEELKLSLTANVSIEIRLSIVASAIYKFQSDCPEAYGFIAYKNISGFGYLASVSTTIELKAKKTLKFEAAISLDDEDNCPLFDGMIEACKGNMEMEIAIKSFINETLIGICGDMELSSTNRSSVLFKAIYEFFAIHPEWELTFFEKCQIKGFGSFQMLYRITRSYWQKTQIKVIFEGEVEECIFVKSIKANLEMIYADVKVSVTMKGTLKQWYNLLIQELKKCTSQKQMLLMFIKITKQFNFTYGESCASFIFSMEIEGFGSCWMLFSCGPWSIPHKPPTVSTIAPVSPSKPTCSCTCASFPSTLKA